MNERFKYMPIFRTRQQEVNVLISFDFGLRIFPCLEIFKEVLRVQSQPKMRQDGTFKLKKIKKFEEEYLPIINNINAQMIFVDLPVHLPVITSMKNEVIEFLRRIVANREKRTEYILKLKERSDKIIPIISTYAEITGEVGSILKQEKDIRKHFNVIGIRTFMNTFSRDINQIKKVVGNEDYVIMDWGDIDLDEEDEEIMEIVEELNNLKCNVIVHRNPIPETLSNVSLIHGELVTGIDNSLLSNFMNFGGLCFSDYAGIKKDQIGGGGVISPGFLYYDAVENNFYGFRYQFGSHKKDLPNPKLEEFETTIVPSVIGSNSTLRMREHIIDFLGEENIGWSTIKNIELGPPEGESGKNQAKFKRIAMEHYLHCVRNKLDVGKFD